jgi:transcriptional regulator with XRE-family HTH domain
MDMNVDINLIKVERNKRGWTQSQLADICSLSLRTIKRIEKLGLVSHESVQSLAAAFEVTVDELTISVMKAENTLSINLDKGSWRNKPFYWLGSVGFIITALMHMLMAILLSSGSGYFNHSMWFALYVVWGSFLIMGIPKKQSLSGI